ncbi:hypothetical protein E2C01_026935 [Portunus trituberculatus]|uniref:Uncharacterized protein n=1 Tax=Portunus trituberculatus TaxID=210409 RepID=A0A5B7EGM0_PORTR|nr:hypothetical protein [Portunus trituberculatus]
MRQAVLRSVPASAGRHGRIPPRLWWAIIGKVTGSRHEVESCEANLWLSCTVSALKTGVVSLVSAGAETRKALHPVNEKPCCDGCGVAACCVPQ